MGKGKGKGMFGDVSPHPVVFATIRILDPRPESSNYDLASTCERQFQIIRSFFKGQQHHNNNNNNTNTNTNNNNNYNGKQKHLEQVKWLQEIAARGFARSVKKL